jgi:hypothetical protein
VPEKSLTLRPAINLALTAALVVGGVLLLRQDAFFLRDRWDPSVGTRFSGSSLRFLAGTLFGLAAFAATVAAGWLRGSVPRPAERILVHPAYKGQIFLRNWYVLLLTFVCLALAFRTAERGVPNPALAAPEAMEAVDRSGP